MTPQDDDRVIVHTDVTGGKRLGHLPHGFPNGLNREEAFAKGTITVDAKKKLGPRPGES